MAGAVEGTELDGMRCTWGYRQCGRVGLPIGIVELVLHIVKTRLGILGVQCDRHRLAIPIATGLRGADAGREQRCGQVDGQGQRVDSCDIECLIQRVISQ